MNANTAAAAPPSPATTLGGFLRDRRARLAAPANAGPRRRTPGLRREEVAARAGVSVTWYTWLEQGRGGPPSAAALERLAVALDLDAPAREVLFLLAQQRPPPVRSGPAPAMPSAVQGVLDALETSPAYVKTRTWDIIAWNAAAAVVLGDGLAGPHPERNSLRRLFGDPKLRGKSDWETYARFAVAVFRRDVARAGPGSEAAALAGELQATSADFRCFWSQNEVRNHGAGRKRLHHPALGPFEVTYAAFDIEDADGLTMIVFTPVTATDRAAIAALKAARDQAA
ncbi:MAG TPA: helix-turn-helix transcriptional regulator [Caulobacteraceae bacterium]|nr:helix-turn-helix transcriptional regulator [Caulobacteraceae bacterium]